jgi:2-methylcitrate dehydratase PrpD
MSYFCEEEYQNSNKNTDDASDDTSDNILLLIDIITRFFENCECEENTEENRKTSMLYIVTMNLNSFEEAVAKISKNCLKNIKIINLIKKYKEFNEQTKNGRGNSESHKRGILEIIDFLHEANNNYYNTRPRGFRNNNQYNSEEYDENRFIMKEFNPYRPFDIDYYFVVTILRFFGIH